MAGKPMDGHWRAVDGYRFVDVCVSETKSFLLSSALTKPSILEVVEVGGDRRVLADSGLANAEGILGCDESGAFVLLHWFSVANEVVRVSLGGGLVRVVETPYKFRRWVAVSGGFVARADDEILRFEPDGGLSSRREVFGVWIGC